LLLSAEARDKAGAHITDMGETVQRLMQAGRQHEQLAALAHAHQAQEDGDQQHIAKCIKNQNEAIEGTGSAATKDLGFPELSAPHLVLASPAGIQSTSAQSTHFASGEHIALTSGGDTSLAVGRSLYASIKEKWSVFVHQLGIKLIAASGKVQIQAQSDDLELLAHKVLKLISTSDWIHLQAKKGIRLQGAHSALIIGGDDDAIVGHTPGVFHVYSDDPKMLGPKMVTPAFADMPGKEICFSCLLNAMQAAKGIAYL